VFGTTPILLVFGFDLNRDKSIPKRLFLQDLGEPRPSKLRGQAYPRLMPWKSVSACGSFRMWASATWPWVVRYGTKAQRGYVECGEGEGVAACHWISAMTATWLTLRRQP
jgi:hypothetical protein